MAQENIDNFIQIAKDYAKAELTDAIFNAPFYCGQQYYVDIKTETKIVLSKLL